MLVAFASKIRLLPVPNPMFVCMEFECEDRSGLIKAYMQYMGSITSIVTFAVGTGVIDR